MDYERKGWDVEALKRYRRSSRAAAHVHRLRVLLFGPMGLAGNRRRGGALASGIVPPNAASRRADSREIKASSPACTRAVFSLMPVSSLASAMRASSRTSVAL